MSITSAPVHKTDNITAQLHFFRNEQTSAYPHPIQMNILFSAQQVMNKQYSTIFWNKHSLDELDESLL